MLYYSALPMNGEEGTFLCPMNNSELELISSENDRAVNLEIFLSSLSPTQAKELRALDGEMQMSGKAKEDPIREIMALLGDKWSHLILLILRSGQMGHARLKRSIELLSHEESISQRVLTLKLRNLERNGLVSRNISDEIPPRVDYELTLIGDGLTLQSRQLVEWIKNNSRKIEEARICFNETLSDQD